VSVLATVRPDAWNLALFVHVLGAMVLVGALVLAGSALLLAWRDGSATLVRLGYRALLVGAIPAYVGMRVGAQWILSKEDLGDSNASWIGLGFSIADGGLVLLLVATLLGGLALRRATSGDAPPSGLGRASAVIVSLVVVAYLVAIWAMTTKPV
jgi:hypothetical protein